MMNQPNDRDLHSDDAPPEGRDVRPEGTEVEGASVFLPPSFPGLPGISELERLSEIWSAAANRNDNDASGGSRPLSPAANTGENLERLEELADDMLVLMRRIRELDERQQLVITRLDQLTEIQATSSRNASREVDTLRRDLLTDRRHTATAELIGELMPLIERMQTMHATLDPAVDGRMLAQLTGVVESLEGCLRRMGGRDFVVEPGTPFNALQMTAANDCDFPSAVVSATVTPGMACGQLVLRRAVVRLSSTKPGNSEDSGAGTRE